MRSLSLAVIGVMSEPSRETTDARCQPSCALRHSHQTKVLDRHPTEARLGLIQPLAAPAIAFGDVPVQQEPVTRRQTLEPQDLQRPRCGEDELLTGHHDRAFAAGDIARSTSAATRGQHSNFK